MDDLLQEFIAETRETLEALSGEIVAWEADPSDRARLDSIFRFVHTVKGSCGFLDLPRLSRLSHAAEDVLAAVRDGGRTADAALVNAVLAIVDRIGEIVEAIDAGVALDDTSDDLLVAALDKDAVAATLVSTQVAIRAPTRSVRLSVDLLDRMMGGMSDMVLARNELARRLRSDGADPALEAALERLSTTVAEMRDTVTRTRMQTIDALFSALPRMVRDTAASVGKAVALTIDGADVELDRELIEMMRDPLVHIIRNAVDHGLETPAERRKAGKRESGRLAVSARQSGNRIIVEIVDDGRGIDTDRLVAKLIAQDPRREPELRRMSERQRLDLIFEPGLSSRDEVTAISGRGVGMDIVRANIEQIGGRIELESRLGKGLTIAIHVPLTLAILSAVVVGAGETCFALPRQAIDEIVAMRSSAIRVDRLGAQMVVRVRERLMPLVDLGELMGLRDAPPADATLVIVDIPGGSFALIVDTVLDTEELVVKPAAPAVMAAGFYAGQTLPDSGLPLLLLDCSGIAARAGIRFERVAMTEIAAVPAAEAVGASALLFRDLDGCRRAIALAAIDRVEQVPADAIMVSGGRLRLTVADRTVPLAAAGPVPETGVVPVLRLHDDLVEVGYPIAEALEIVALPAEIASVAQGGAIAGVAVIDGEPTELVDPLWLLASAADGEAQSDRPLCLLEGSDAGWMESFLKPALESAGYRVTAALASGERADVRLAMLEDSVTQTGDAPVVRLGRRRGEGVYRYDRAELLAAVAATVAGRKA